MTDAQATEVVMLIRAATGGQVDEEKVGFFTAALLHLDYEIAISTATTGTVIWRFFPSWAEFKEIYRTQLKLREPVGEQRSDTSLPKEKYGTAAPEWVWVWGWCRTQREPRNLIPFPQQDLPDTEHSLSMEEYEAIREEWIAAGKPKATTPLPLQRVGKE